MAAKKTSKKPVSKKPVARKPVARKPVAEKPVVKKAVVKQPAAKQPAAKKPAAKRVAVERKLQALAKSGPRAVVEQVFTDVGWDWEPEELASGVISYRVPVDEDIREVQAILDPQASRFRLYFVFEALAAEDRLGETALFLTFANSNLGDGNFELAMSSGETRYKTSLDFCDVTLSPYLVRNMIFHAMHVTQIYGAALMEVAEEGRSAGEAIAEAEAKPAAG